MKRHSLIFCGLCSISTVAFTSSNSQAVGLFAQPLHSSLIAIRCVERLSHAIALELDFIACRTASESARAVQVLNGDLIIAVAAIELKKCALWATPLAKPPVSYRCSDRTRRNLWSGRCRAGAVVFTACNQHGHGCAGNERLEFKLHWRVVRRSPDAFYKLPCLLRSQAQ